MHDLAAAETGKRVSLEAKPAILLHRVDFPVPVFPITNILRRMLFLTSLVCWAMTASGDEATLKIPKVKIPKQSDTVWSSGLVIMQRPSYPTETVIVISNKITEE